MIKKLLQFADTCSVLFSWKDFALLKVCMAAVGILVGLSIPSRAKRAWAWIASFAFIATYIPLMAKFLPCFKDAMSDDTI